MVKIAKARTLVKIEPSKIRNFLRFREPKRACVSFYAQAGPRKRASGGRAGFEGQAPLPGPKGRVRLAQNPSPMRGGGTRLPRRGEGALNLLAGVGLYPTVRQAFVPLLRLEGLT